MDRSKLLDAKERWAREGRLLVPPSLERRRLPPGQELVRDWPVLDLGTQPNLRPKDWRLTAGGLVENPIDWGWDDLNQQPLRDNVSDIHCVTSWSRFDNRWTGLSTEDFLEIVGPKSKAEFVRVRCYDGYGTTIPLADFAAPGVMIATHWEGQALSRAHGGPVRLVVPQLYFWKSAKWLRHLWFTDRDAPGYWEARGYHRRGDPWRQERYGR
jgi:DMSO/TMAO reductase YedYZ molybdopterin-dependent catalytic subunit